MAAALFDKLRAVRPAHGLAADVDIERIVHEAAGVVAMALDRGAAHVVSPGAYPLPANVKSLERAFADRVRALPAEERQALGSQAAERLGKPREPFYGTAGTLDPRGAADLVTQALSRPLPAALTAIARRARQKLVTHAAPRARAAERPRVAPLHPPTFAPQQVELRVVEVECLDKTADVGRDEIEVGAVVQDLMSRDAPTVSGPIDLGKYKVKDGAVARDDLVRTFALVPHMQFEHTLTAAAFLAEKDFGGFGSFLKHNGAISDREMNQITFVAIMTLVGAACGVVGGAETFVALTTALGPAAVFATGFGGALLGMALGAVELAVAGVVIILLVDVLRGLFGDDLFHREALSITVGPDGNIRESGAPTFRHDVHFERRGAKKRAALYRLRLEWRVLMGLASGPPEVAEQVGPPTIAPDEQTAIDNLDNIDHIVVLMLENRSFDHILGYLGLEGLADGVTEGMSNPLEDGTPAVVAQLPTTQFLRDPGHSFCAVRVQLGIEDENCKTGLLVAEPVPPMNGFAKHFAGVIAARQGVDDDGNPKDPDFALNQVKAQDIMGYYGANQVPVYDQLARTFGVADRWYSSFPGNTWVNRTMAFTGRPATRANGDFIIDNDMPKNEQSLFRSLPDSVTWAFYSQDFPSLLCVDAPHGLAHLGRLKTMDDFLNDAAAGTLPNVSWIDPNFIDYGPVTDAEAFDSTPWFITTCNDDHPPADIAHGQVLAATVFSALFRSPSWEKTLFVLLYDEHGGFHDHRPPPPTPESVRSDERRDAHFALLGARVPALVVSPWIGRGLTVSRFEAQRPLRFDHASIMKTIFTRFSPGTALPPRVQAAEHLGWLLNEPAPRFPLPAAAELAPPLPHSPTPHLPTPHLPTPHLPTPHLPTPHSPTSHSPTPHQPTPHLPTPHLPTSHPAGRAHARTALLDRIGVRLGGLLAERPLLRQEEPPTDLQLQIVAERRELENQGIRFDPAHRRRR